MPTYDYRCKDCGDAFEIFQSMNDEPLTRCGKCGGIVKRLIGGGSGIIFKGSGFYKNDSRSDSGSKSATATDTKPKAEKPGA
jgi:putative FmdB family regulatory protein